MKNDIYQKMEEKGLHPFIFERETDNLKTEIIVWGKNEEEAFKKIKEIDDLATLKEIKQVTHDEAKTIQNKQLELIKATKRELQIARKRYFNNMKQMWKELDMDFSDEREDFSERMEMFSEKMEDFGGRIEKFFKEKELFGFIENLSDKFLQKNSEEEEKEGEPKKADDNTDDDKTNK